MLCGKKLDIKKKSPSRDTCPLGRADLHIHSTQPDTDIHCKTTDMVLLHRVACLFTAQLLLVFTVPIHEGMARLSCIPRWFIRPLRITHPSTEQA